MKTKITVNWVGWLWFVGALLALWFASCGGNNVKEDCSSNTIGNQESANRTSTEVAFNEVSSVDAGCTKDASESSTETKDSGLSAKPDASVDVGGSDSAIIMDSAIICETCLTKNGFCLVNVPCDDPSVYLFDCVNCPMR